MTYAAERQAEKDLHQRWKAAREQRIRIEHRNEFEGVGHQKPTEIGSSIGLMRS